LPLEEAGVGRVLGVVMVGVLQVVPLPAGDPGQALAAAAARQVGVTVRYDPAYRRLAYPGGDVPMDRGVCTDVLIRAYRVLGVDLQVEVHQDMRQAWPAYPNPWGLRGPDRNIDHRRVPNLATFFRRHGQVIPPSRVPADFLPGDVVTWRLPSGLPHIGLVAGGPSPAGVPWIIHNIGEGVRREDRLFQYEVTGHFRYLPMKVP
jgi:hypothetical protein